VLGSYQYSVDGIHGITCSERYAASLPGGTAQGSICQSSRSDRLQCHNYTTSPLGLNRLEYNGPSIYLIFEMRHLETRPNNEHALDQTTGPGCQYTGKCTQPRMARGLRTNAVTQLSWSMQFGEQTGCIHSDAHIVDASFEKEPQQIKRCEARLIQLRAHHEPPFRVSRRVLQVVVDSDYSSV
jgi:hypothetical protein